MNRKRPHESPDCRCAACDAYDREEEDTPLWGIRQRVTLHELWLESCLAERDAWEQFLVLCDLAAQL